MKVLVIPIVIGALGMIPKGLVKELEELEIRGRADTIQTKLLLRSARILRRVLDTWGDLLSLRLQWRTINWRLCEKLERNNNNNNNNSKNEIKKIIITIISIIIINSNKNMAYK